jgi:transposase
MHNVPGRKTDVADSVWIAQLVEHGLVRPSFIPPAPVRDLRDLTRLRTALTQERTRAIQRLEKVLQDAGIKLTSRVGSTSSRAGAALLPADPRAGQGRAAALAEASSPPGRGQPLAVSKRLYGP